MPSLHIAVLVNALSGSGKAVRTGLQVEQALSQRGILFTVFKEVWPDDLLNFSEVWLCGGDGTVNYFINKYKNSTIPFAVFKGGTGNDIAFKLYRNISPQQQVDVVLKAAVKKIDAGSCNGQLYVNSFGLGFDGEVLKSMKSVRSFGGHFGYLVIVIRKIFTFKEFHFTIRTEKKVYDDKFLLVAVNNSSRTGGGFLISPKASLTDGFLDMVLCKKMSVLRRLRYLPVIEKGKHVDLPFIVYLQETNVRINCSENVFGQLDGELISGKDFEISVLRGALRVKY